MPLPDLDYEPTIPAVVRRAATTFGNNDFIVMPDRRMSYADAELASRRVGKQLLAAGVGKGTRIGFMFPYGTDWVVAWLAIARIGAIGMPFSTSYKPAELRKALRFGDVDTLLVASTMFGEDHLAYVEDAVPGLAEAGPEPLRIPELPFLRHVRVSGPSDRLWAKALPLDFRLGAAGADPGSPGPRSEGEDISDEFFEAVEAEVTPSDLMMTIFTSGTTSEPKGVVHTHGNFLRHGANLARFAGLTSESRRLCAMPFFWIGGVGLTLNFALSVGSAILCVEKFEPDAVLELMEAEGATELAVWPQLGQRMQRYIVETGRDVSTIPAFTPRPTTDYGLLHNSLGMTETMGPHSAPGPEAERILPEEMRGSFGLLVPCVEHRIADPETNATLDEGDVGEICIRGYSLMNGLYKWERHETFDDDGWYHTGDKGLHPGRLPVFPGPPERDDQDLGFQRGPPGGRTVARVVPRGGPGGGRGPPGCRPRRGRRRRAGAGGRHRDRPDRDAPAGRRRAVELQGAARACSCSARARCPTWPTASPIG